MKFQVRDGFVVRITNVVQIDDNKTETQELNYYGGQKCDLTADQADLHAHKLEPLDKEATAYLAAKVKPQDPVQVVQSIDVEAIVTAAVTAALAAQAAQAAAAPKAPAS